MSIAYYVIIFHYNLSFWQFQKYSEIFVFLSGLCSEILMLVEEILRCDLIFDFEFYSMKVIVMDLKVKFLIFIYVHSFLL